LLLEIQQGRHTAFDTLVDVSAIPELGCLEVRGDELFIGAGVPVSVITQSPLVCEHALAVSEACGLIGGPQVRNTATLGGNVAHALPAADGMIGLVAMDAEVEIASADGLRRQPILSLFAGPGKSTLLLDQEILVGFYLPLRARPAAGCGQASAFSRVMRPQGVALPIINLAVWLERHASVDGVDVISAVRVAVGPAGPVPRRAVAIEELLSGAALNAETLDKASQIWSESMRFRTSPRRSTAEYRRHLCSILFERVLLTAWERAGARMLPVTNPMSGVPAGTIPEGGME
jgi:carbon-monoxide dehydrogenase medium subunit